ncbi:winged helix-turn-helix transcriptional regulator [Mycobacterium sp. SM1]|uniref:winged helix-turn-helix domain-containing protein n=1 Tax=Mycobacterium sp. SM1 TaxID=2816243 RepID=UPI001BCB02C4|nr:winged helix-turn-helix domain-containing protein [Mycobacterium sp. SM1]MBS4730568.1 winged helix-turn-helix transcriptional regulator [Mycobacterium sp. SM1]
MRSDAPLLMPIFRSRHQAELLTRLLLNPDQEYTLSELSRELNVPLTTLQRESQRLADVGLIRERKQGRNRLLSANPSNRATGPLTQLVMMTFGPVEVIGQEFAIDGVEQVIIFGSWAARYVDQPGPPPKDIDVLVVGSISELTLYEAADRAQRRIGIEVNPVRCTPQQWAEPGDWTLIIEIRNRPYTVVYRAEVDAA